MKRFQAFSIIFVAEVVGKYYWNTDEDVGFDDYSELTDADASVCMKNHFDMANYNPPPPSGFSW